MFFRKVFKKYKALVIFPLMLLAIANFSDFKFSTDKSPPIFAEEIIKKCSQDLYKSGCYEKEVPKLMDKISMEEAFEVSRLITQMDKEYTNTHLLAHQLSRREIKKSPDKWKDVLSRCVTGKLLNTNGCIHGVIIERFRTDSLTDDEIAKIKEDLGNLCQGREGWNPTGLEQGSCYHALGHLVMYLTGGDIKKSLSLCQNLDRAYLCFSGAFMQIYQPIDADDFALVYNKQPTKETVEQFCSEYSGEQFASCWNESWPLFWQQLGKDLSKVTSFCDHHLNEDFKRGCFVDLFNIISDNLKFKDNPERAKNFCLSLTNPYQKECFAMEAARLIKKNVDSQSIEKALASCRQLDDQGQRECLEHLAFYAGYNFYQDSEEQLEICQVLDTVGQATCPKQSPNILREKGIF